MSALGFDHAPARVEWELTGACDLACRHCRVETMPAPATDELRTEECEGVLDALAAAGDPLPHVMFTGGDPMLRPDLVHLVRHASARGLEVSLAPAATPHLTRDLVHALKAAGLAAMALSVDGPTAAQHDGLRGVLAGFGWTLAAAQHIAAADIPLEVSTLVTADTQPELEEIAKLVARLGAGRWSLAFPVGVGCGRVLRQLPAIECERTLRWLAVNAGRWPFAVTTTEAPQYQRLIIQRAHDTGETRALINASAPGRAFGMRDGNGIMFITASGAVTPSGFLPLVAGNVRLTDPLRIYREGSIFKALRTPDLFKGRCGMCGFRAVCGGSRARAFAATSDLLGEDPLCAWEPAAAAAV